MLLTGVIADQIYTNLDQEKLLPEEQKGCRKGSRGTNDLLYIDKVVIKEVKSRNKNLAMALIDYKKAYDMVPHSWIIECLDLFGVAENIKSLLVNSMEKWNIMLCSGNFELGEVEIKRDIFQEDSLSSLVFVLALVPLSLILRNAIDRKGRKLFTIYGALHPKSDVDRLYIPRKEEGRGLIFIEDCVELAIRGLEVYVHGSEES